MWEHYCVISMLYKLTLVPATSRIRSARIGPKADEGRKARSAPAIAKGTLGVR